MSGTIFGMRFSVYYLVFILITGAPLYAKVHDASFGKTSEGRDVRVYTLTNQKGLKLKLLTLGARILEFKVPDRFGKLENITLGLESVPAYEKHNAHFGGIVGRYANRIQKGQFTLEGKTFSLAKNNGPNHLHGGIQGFDSVVWEAEKILNKDGEGIKFSYQSKDGEEGYPGNLSVQVSYVLNHQNELSIDYEARTDQATVVNLTNHAYWNLAGVGKGDVLQTELFLNADQYLPIDKTSIPTGEFKSVKGTVMDFTKPQSIGSRIQELKKDPEGTRGYDHCYILNKGKEALSLAARAKDPKSGRVMELWTTEPGLQLYIGNFLDGSKVNGGFPQHAAFCLEAQHYPDSPNHPSFPTTLLRSGEIYRQKTLHRFLVEK